MQLHHHNTRRLVHELEIVLLCDHIASPANVGSLFRIADSFGVTKIVFGGAAIDPSSPRLKRTARATQNTMSYQDEVDTLESLQQYIEAGFTALAVEITDQSLPIATAVAQLKTDKLVLVIGNESAGVSEAVLQQCHQHVHINMFGQNSSMNVAQATAISLYELTKT